MGWLGSRMLVSCLGLMAVCVPGCDARDPTQGSARGVAWIAAGASPGYVLYSPLLSTTTYLVDTRSGRVVHAWASQFAPGASVYLLDNGHLLRPARDPSLPFFTGGGQGGRIQEFTWDGELVWDYVIGSRQLMQHHDIEPLPNGNVLAIAWERRSRDQAIQAGRIPQAVPEQGLWPDCLLEIEPRPPAGGRVVWEWHVWDHLIQQVDPVRDNYGKVSEHPELIDINGDQGPRRFTEEVLERLRALGYVARGATAPELRADLLHTNSIAYHPRLDQIALSVFQFNEVWVIDHGTTTEEAAGHTGGRAGRGGDLLYRWGNPRAYGRGTVADQRLFGQHDARWIPVGLPGAGNLLVFDNGAGRPGGDFSAVLELRTPVDAGGGRYPIGPEAPFGPDAPAWAYTAAKRESFFAEFISGAHRLANGNTFICSGPTGLLFEVTAAGDVVWSFRNPFTGDAPNPAGDPPYSVFRATHIPSDHPAVAGRLLAPLADSPARSRQ